MSAMEHILLAGVLGIGFSALQLWLMQRVLHFDAMWKKGLLLAAKVPLWALAFAGVALWWGVGPLLAFGIAAGATYLLVAIIVWVRTHPRTGESGGHKGE